MSNGNFPERRVEMAERLIRVETELQHLTQNTDRLVNSFEASLENNRRTHQTVTELVHSVHNQSTSLVGLKTDLASLRAEMIAKASLEKVNALEQKVDSHAKIIDRAAAILRAIEWTLKIGGPATVATAVYYIFTGDLPGGN